MRVALLVGLLLILPYDPSNPQIQELIHSGRLVVPTRHTSAARRPNETVHQAVDRWLYHYCVALPEPCSAPWLPTDEPQNGT